MSFKDNLNERTYLISEDALGRPDEFSRSIPVLADNNKRISTGNFEDLNHVFESEYQNTIQFIEFPNEQQYLIEKNAKELKEFIINILIEKENVYAPSINHMRSHNEFLGYNIQTKDGELIGHVDDFIIESETWKMQYLLVDTRNWLTGGKKILLSPAWIERIRWNHNLVSIDLKKEAIAKSPAYDPRDPLDNKMESKLFKFYIRQHSST
jgi:sporulation protein YlmC with PRC-barrel domain